MAERHTAHGYWLEEAAPVEPLAALDGERSADVVVVGGGYTGLWAAWQISELEPGASVIVLEAERCGEGPSGRNGGFVNTLWFSLPNLRRRYGDAAALAIAEAAAEAVHGVGRFCAEQDVDAWFRQAGYLQVSTAPGWDGHWDEAVAACRELGVAEAGRELSAAEVAARCASPLFRGGAFYPGAATVQPARLVRGLRERLRGRGVEIFENSPGRRSKDQGSGVLIETPGGRVRAGAAVMASGGKLLEERELRHRLTLTSSHMVITEPVPEVLEEIGWTGGECVTDSRAMIHYFRTTPDGRIAFGWGGGPVVFGSQTRGRSEINRKLVAEVEAHLLRFFPGLAGKRIPLAWGGPIDVSPSHLPVIRSLDPAVHAGFGYTGNGVGPSHMVGRSLASLALERRDDASRLAIVDPPPLPVPPEPFRYLGGAVIRRALVRNETAVDESRRPNRLSQFVAGIPERIGIHVGR